MGYRPPRGIGSTMTELRTIRQRVESGLGAGVLGRERELAFLQALVAPDGVSLVYLFGPQGIGKTALVSAFEASLAGRGFHVVKLSGSSIEPQSGAFVAAVGAALEMECHSPVELYRALAIQNKPLMLILDDA